MKENKEKTWICMLCETEARLVSGIGYYCSNPKCKNIDGHLEKEWFVLK